MFRVRNAIILRRKTFRNDIETGDDIFFDRHGENIRTDHFEAPELDERSQQKYKEMQDIFSKEEEAVSKYGENMYFWPDEIKVAIYGDLYGLPYAIPEPEEYAAALEDARKFIMEKYGADALDKLGDYKVGYLFQKLPPGSTGGKAC